MQLPAPLNELSSDALLVLEPHLERVRFQSGDCLFRMGSPADACYVVEEGDVRIEIEDDEVDSDTVLAHLGPGSLVGELGLLDRQPRSAAAYAQGEVVVRRITADGLDRLSKTHPAIALAVVSALGRDAAQKLRHTTGRLTDALADDRPDPEVDEMVARAAAAQAMFERWTDEEVDRLLHALASAFAARAEELAQRTVRDTGVGNAADKTFKNQVASMGIYRTLAGKPARGPLASDPLRKVTELASPVGVIFALVPMTNPIATAIFKTLIGLKARNALILSFSHQCLGLAEAAGAIVHQTLDACGAPRDLVQWVRKRTSRRKTAKFMGHDGVALILATGGAGMVKAAYSSGTPAIGVGPGNAPALVCADADLDAAAQAIVLSKAFDNGLICGAEHNLVVDARVRGRFLDALERHGAAVLTADEARAFTATIVHPRRNMLRLDIVGQSAQTIAERTGITRPYPIRLLIVETASTESSNPLAGEKMAPLLSLFTADDDEHGLALCRALLRHSGAGHTAIIHTHDARLIERFGGEMPASRILVNSPGTQGSCGLTTGLECSFTLGCGTFGGNSTTDNVTYRHLMNIKRVAYPLVAGDSQNLAPIAGSVAREPHASSAPSALSTGEAPPGARGAPPDDTPSLSQDV